MCILIIIIFAAHGVGGNLNVPLSQRQGAEYTAMDAMKASFDLEPLLMEFGKHNLQGVVVKLAQES